MLMFYLLLFILFPIKEHLVGFQSFAITPNARMKILCLIFIYNTFLNSILGVALMPPMV